MGLERKSEAPPGRPVKSGVALAGAVSAVVINILVVVAILVAGDMAILTTSFFIVMLAVASISAVGGQLVRRTGRGALGFGVLIGSAAAIPLELILAVAWVAFLVVAGSEFCSPSSTYWCFS